MTEERRPSADKSFLFVDISDQDVYEAMAEISGFLDITTDDFKTLYLHAYQHAVERLSCAVKVRAVMNAGAPSVAADTPLVEVAERMTATGAGFMPVTDAGGKVVGIIARSDFLACIAPDHEHEFLRLVGEHRRGERGVPDDGRVPQARDIMHAPAVTVGVDDAAKDVIGTVKRTGLTRFPVVDGSGNLVGVLALNDLMKQCFL